MGIRHVHKAYVMLVIQYTLRKCSLCVCVCVCVFVSVCQAQNVTYILPDTDMRDFIGYRLICPALVITQPGRGP